MFFTLAQGLFPNIFNLWNPNSALAGQDQIVWTTQADFESATTNSYIDTTSVANSIQLEPDPDPDWINGRVGTAMEGKQLYKENFSATWGPGATCGSPQCATSVDPSYPSNKALKESNIWDYSSYPARNACKTIGARMPYGAEVQELYAGRYAYGTSWPNTNAFWSATESSSLPDRAKAKSFFTGAFYEIAKSTSGQVRCVRETPYAPTGSLGGAGSSDVGLRGDIGVDSGFTFGDLNFNADALASGQAIKFGVKTSTDGTNWSEPYGPSGNSMNAYVDFTYNGGGQWTKKKPITITDFQSNFQTKLTITYDSDMQADFDDIRFFDETSRTELPYWIEEKTDNFSATVWFKTGSNNNISMYYGNTSATSSSDGDSTFDFFDDFPGSALDTNKWTLSSGSAGVSGGVLSLWDSVALDSNTNISSPSTLRARTNIPATSWSGFGFRINPYVSPHQAIMFYRDGVADKYISRDSGGESIITSDWTTGAYSIKEIKWNDAGNSIGFFDNEVEISNSPFTTADRIPGDDLRVAYQSANTSTLTDWILVRKFTTTEPSSSLGSETDGFYIDWSSNFFGQEFGGSVYSDLSNIPEARYIDIVVMLETSGTTTPKLHDVTFTFNTLETPDNTDMTLFRADGSTYLKDSGGTIVGSGDDITGGGEEAYTSESTVKLEASNLTCGTTGGGDLCSDTSDGRFVEVEVKEVGTAFDESNLLTGTSVDNGDETFTSVVDITGLEDTKDYHMQIRAKDAQGRVSAWQSYGTNLESEPDITVEQTPPTGTLTIDEGDYTNQATVNLTLSASDIGDSNLSEMRFSNDGSTWSNWETYATAKAWNLVTGEGGSATEETKNVYVQYRDNAGNVSNQFAFNEDFSTTTYKDAGNTTANWDTINNKVIMSSNFDWVQSDTSPDRPAQARGSVASAYDEARQEVILYGGRTKNDGYQSDTWKWDGTKWIQLFPTNTPPANSFDNMVYDSVRQEIIYFSSGQTWSWNGTNWTQKSPANSPSARDDAYMAFDRDRGVAILFGGRIGTSYQNDTWEWDGTNWSQKSPVSKPSVRAAGGMEYDPIRQETILFAGKGTTLYTTFGDTWSWNGTNWTQLSPAVNCLARRWHFMTYHPVREKIIVTGGAQSNSSIPDNQRTCEWDGTNWSYFNTSSIPADTSWHANYGNGDAGMAYDILRDQMIIYSGHYNTTANIYTYVGTPIYSTTNPSVVQSSTIDATSETITKATLSSTETLNSQTITYEMTADGTSWESVTSGVEHTFTNTGTDLRFRVTLSTGDTAVTPELLNVSVAYSADAISDSIKYDLTDPIVTSDAIEKPNGGEGWAGGSTKTVEWNAGSGTDVDPGSGEYADIADPGVALFYNSIGDTSPQNYISDTSDSNISPWIEIDSTMSSPLTDGVNGGCSVSTGDSCYEWHLPNNVNSANMRLAIGYIDNAGNIGFDTSDASFTTQADNTAPSSFNIEASSPSDDEWKNATPDFAWTEATDDEAGLDHYELWMTQTVTPTYPTDFTKRVDVGNNGEISGLTAAPDLSGNEGTWYYFIRAANGAYDPSNPLTFTDTGYGVTDDPAQTPGDGSDDNENNTTDNTAYFRVDDTAPSGTITIKVNLGTEEDATPSYSVDLHLTEDDGTGSGTNLIQYSNNNVTYCTPESYETTEVAFDIRDDCIGGNTLTTRGTRTVYAKLIDNVGNTSNIFQDDIIYDITNPNNPVLVSATVQGVVVSGSTNTIRVDWNTATDPPEGGETVSGVDGYNIYRSEDPNSGFVKVNGVLVDPGTTQYDDATCTDGVTYYYKVETVDNATNASNYGAETAVSESLTDLTAPSTPTGFQAAGSDSTTVEVKWQTTPDNGTANNKRAASYEVERTNEAVSVDSSACSAGTLNNDADYSNQKTVPIDNSPPVDGVTYADPDYSYSDSGLTLEKWYCYRAKAIDAATNESTWDYFPARGNSAPSFVDMGSSNFVNLAFTNGHDSETVRPGDTLTITFKITDPEGISDLLLDSEDPGSLALQTIQLRDGLSAIVSGFDPAVQVPVPANRTEEDSNTYAYTYDYAIPSNNDYGTYTVKVRVKDKVGIDGSTHDIYKEVTFKLKPDVPGNFTATGNNSTTIGLSWDAPANGGLRTNNTYEVWRKLAADDDLDENYSQVCITTDLSCTDSGRDMNTAYSYKIRAFDVNDNDSGWTNIVDITTPTPAVPENSNVNIIDASTVETGENRFLLVWEAPVADGGSNTTEANFASYVIERSENGGAYFEVRETTDKYYVDVGLSNVITYSYRLRTKDTFGNLSRDDLSPVKEGTPGAKPNVSIVSESTSTSSATITWTATQIAETQIIYGTQAGNYTKMAGVPGTRNAGENHAVTLTGLAPNTTYYYKVVSRNELGFANDFTERNINTKNFTIQHNKNSDVITTTTSATIKWKTGEVESNSFVSIQQQKVDGGPVGESKIYGSDTPVAAGEWHEVLITDLKPDTPYSYIIKSTDDGKYSVYSDLDYFRTKAYDADQFTINPSASNIAEENITATSAKIVWNTAVATTTWVDFGTKSGVYSQSAGDDVYNTVHVVELKNLTPGTTYYYRVRGDDTNGIEYTSKEYSFTAVLKPQVSDIGVDVIDPYTVKIKFITNVACETSVAYGVEGTTNLRAGSSELVRSHEVTLEELEDATTYSYYVEVKDSLDNTAKSATSTFKTPLDTQGAKVDNLKLDILPMGESDETASVIISWNTNKPTTTKVEYDEGVISSKLGQSTIEDESLNSSHTVIIKDLTPSATYKFKIAGKDKRGNKTESSDYTFVTPAKEKSIWQLILRSIEDTFSWVSNVGAFFRR